MTNPNKREVDTTLSDKQLDEAYVALEKQRVKKVLKKKAKEDAAARKLLMIVAGVGLLMLIGWCSN